MAMAGQLSGKKVASLVAKEGVPSERRAKTA